MRQVCVERIRAADPGASALAHWGGLSPEAIAAVARAALPAAGTCLPATWLAGAVVVPVVQWRHSALADRLASGMGAILDRVTLRDRSVSGDDPEPVPLRILASVVISRIAVSWDALARLSQYGQVIMCAPDEPGPTEMTVMECGYFGYTLVTVSRDARRRKVLVPGHPGARPGTEPVAHQLRMRQEQLFDLALQMSALPPEFQSLSAPKA